MNRPRATRRVQVCLLLLLGFAACEQEHGPATPAEAGKAKAGAGVKTAPQAATDGGNVKGAPYVYSALNRRDPFRSYLTDLREREQAERESAPRTETETFDTTQYRLSAIISGHSQPSAMVEDPTGKGHVLRIGDRIGKHMGRITNIDATGLNVVETFFDGTGKPLEVPSVMRLPQNDDIAAPAP